MRMQNRFVTRAVAAVCLAAGAVACHSIVDLDEKPPTFLAPQTFFRTDADAQSAVLGAYALLAQGLRAGYSTPAWGWQGYQFAVWCEDNEMTCWNWLGGGWGGRMGADNTALPWITDYAMVGRTNDVLANVPGAAGISPEMKTLSVAQARFLRGWAYFDLIRRFGGVPLRTESYKPDASLGDLPRASYAEVYSVITSDLRFAADSLPENYSGMGAAGALPTQSTAWGMLAKVYLEMAGHQTDTTTLNGKEAIYLDSARVAASKVMADSRLALESDYMSIFAPGHQNSSPEILFAAQSSAVNTSTNFLAQYFSPSGDCDRVFGCGSGFIQMRPDFYETFNPTDKRIEHNRAIAWSYREYKSAPVIFDDSLQVLVSKNLVVADSNYWDGGWDEQCASFLYPHHKLTLRDPADPTKTYTIEKMGVTKQIISLKYLDPSNPATVNPILLRYADVLLMYAEAENRVNPGSGAAATALNEVRARAQVPLFPAASDTIPTAQVGLLPVDARPINNLEWAIWMERSHELYGEFQSVFDLKREGRWLTVMNMVDQRVGHTGYYTTPDQFRSQNGKCRPREAYQLLEPIPNEELGANQAIHQNTGW